MKITKQSNLGIASFVFAILLIVITLLFFLFLAIETLPSYGGCKGCGSDNDKSAFVFFYLYHIIITFVIPYLGSVGFILGLVSLFQKKVKNTYGIIGLAVCGIFLCYVRLFYF